MLERIELKNFRNFSDMNFYFLPWKNVIIWKNGMGKTNILEALSLPSHTLAESSPEYFIEKWKTSVFVRYHLTKSVLWYSYNRENRTKKYFLHTKACSKSQLAKSYPHVISFHPQTMNLLYWPPSERRWFLDSILSQAFPEYRKIHQKYLKIVSSRNAVLKNISEWKSHVSECSFWDETFIQSALEVYVYRKKIIDYFSQYTPKLVWYFFWKIQDLRFQYHTKVDLSQVWESLSLYLQKEKQKELILKKTCIWPHLDDFEILSDGISLIHFASRWEIKSILLWLKFGESNFLLHHSEKQNILFLIDDFLSELDDTHLAALYHHIWEKQCIISSIHDIELKAHKIYL